MAHRALEEAGLFQFAGARETINLFVPTLALPTLGGRTDEYVDLVMLTSGEVALARYTTPPLTFARPFPLGQGVERVPVEVHANDGALALEKFDSTPTRVHLVDPRNVQLWDLVLYAGDMSKLSQVSPNPVGDIMNGRTARLIEQLKDRYRDAANPLAQGIAAAGGQLDLLGVLWQAKASVIFDYAAADTIVQGYLNQLEWFQRLRR